MGDILMTIGVLLFPMFCIFSVCWVISKITKKKFIKGIWIVAMIPAAILLIGIGSAVSNKENRTDSGKKTENMQEVNQKQEAEQVQETEEERQQREALEAQQKAEEEQRKKDKERIADISEFDYTISENIVKLRCYNGKKECVEIKPTYQIEGIDYNTDLSEFNADGKKLNKIIFGDGITDVNKSVFNGSEIETVFFPKSMTLVYDNTLAYFSPEEGNKIQIYYAGTEEEWNAIFTEYQRQSVADAEFGAEKGTALADKLNEMMGQKYDSSEFEFHFSASKYDF